MATETIRNSQTVRLNILPGESVVVAAASGTYNASIVQGAGLGVIATAATGATYGPYASGIAILLTASAASEIDFDIAVTPNIFLPLFKVGYYSGAAKFGAGGSSTEMDAHAFEDWTVINSSASPALGYAAFDARQEIIGSAANNHLVGFQSRPRFSGTGTITNYLEAFNTAIVHNSSGLVAETSGLHVRDVGGTGPITTNYGIKIDDLVRGATNWTIKANCSAPSYFAGNLELTPNRGYLINLHYTGGSWRYRANGIAGGWRTEGANMVLSVAPSNSSGDTPATLIDTLTVEYSSGNVGVGIAATAALHTKAGVSTPGGAGFKLTSGTPLTTPEAGAEELFTLYRYYTGTDGIRRRYAVNSEMIKFKNVTVSGLAALAGALGDSVVVTDALSPAYLAVVVGGGTVVVRVLHNGTAWVCS